MQLCCDCKHNKQMNKQRNRQTQSKAKQNINDKAKRFYILNKLKRNLYHVKIQVSKIFVICALDVQCNYTLLFWIDVLLFMHYSLFGFIMLILSLYTSQYLLKDYRAPYYIIPRLASPLNQRMIVCKCYFYYTMLF